jgi:GNAT superfamily N-acetyltransferase
MLRRRRGKALRRAVDLRDTLAEARSSDTARAVFLVDVLNHLADLQGFDTSGIPSTGVCEIEPLGVAPEHRRHGRAVALCIEVAALVADRGGTHVYINGQPQPGYVASTSAYFAAGFQLVERATTYAALGCP